MNSNRLVLSLTGLLFGLMAAGATVPGQGEAAPARAKAKTAIEQILITSFIPLLQKWKYLTDTGALVHIFGISLETEEKLRCSRTKS